MALRSIVHIEPLLSSVVNATVTLTAAATSTASVSTVVPSISVTAVATSTAAGIVPVPKISVAAIATATAANTSPVPKISILGATSENIGQTAQGGSANLIGTDQLHLCGTFTPTITGTLQSFTAWLQGLVGPPQSCKFALYINKAGPYPDTLVSGSVTAAQLVPEASPMTQYTVDCTTPPTVTAGVNYWIAIITDAVDNTIQIAYTPSTGQLYYGTSTYTSGFPATLPAGYSTIDWQYSIAANITKTLVTASPSAPTPTISVTAVATATASVSAPTLIHSETLTSTPAVATASVAAPVPTITVSSIATATASCVSPTPTTSVTSIATATASVTGPTRIHSETLTSTPAIATAANTSPVPKISITTLAATNKLIITPSIVDDFNRADATPISGDWSPAIIATTGGVEPNLADNKVVPTGADPNAASYYDAASFSEPFVAARAVWPSTPTSGTDFVIGLRSSLDGGYRIRVEPDLSRYSVVEQNSAPGGTGVTVIAVTPFPSYIVSGGYWGLQYSEGGVITVWWKNVNSDWQLLNSATHTDHVAPWYGLIGFRNGNASNDSIDDFLIDEAQLVEVNPVPTISVTSVANSVAACASPTPTISVTTQATATASCVSPIPTVQITSVAAATASVSSPVPTIQITSVATATASVSAPTLVHSETLASTPATATASCASPVPTISITAIATSTAACVAPVPKISVTSIATATASVSAPSLSHSETLTSTPATATASVATPTPKISVKVTFYQPFEPDDLTGLSIWLDASTLGLANGSNLLVWPNQGSGADAPTVGFPKPVIRTNAFGADSDLSVVTFGEHTGGIRMHDTGITFDWTLVYVARMLGPVYGRIAGNYTGVDSEGNILVGWHGGNQDVIYDGDFGTPDTAIPTTTDLKLYSADGETGDLTRFFSDGEFLATASGTHGWFEHFYLNGETFYDAFDVPVGEAELCDCEIAEAVMFDHKLSDSERQQVEDYLRAKWFGVYTPTTASVSAPTITISVSSVATATASSPTPTPTIQVTAVATATASVTAPTISAGTNATVTVPANNATASSVAPLPTIQVTAIATATASVSGPTEIINDSDEPPAATANASVVAPVISISVTAVASSTAACVAPTPVITITTVATATASVVAPSIPTSSNVQVDTGAAMATASVSAPTFIHSETLDSTPATASASVSVVIPSISVTAQSSSTTTANDPTPVVSVTTVANSTADVSSPTPTVSITTVAASTGSTPDPTPTISITTIATATASVSAPSIVSASTTQINAPYALATATALTPVPSISVASNSASTGSVSVPVPTISVTSVAVSTASVVAPSITATRSATITAPVATANASVSAPFVATSSSATTTSPANNSSASVSAPTVVIMVFAQAVSTASGATPTPSIYVVAIAEGQASVINVTPTFSFTANASATASVVSPLPQIQLLAAVALAIAYGNVHTPHVIRIGFANVIVWRRMAYVRLYEIEPDSTVFNLSANDKVLLDNGSESLVWSRSGNEQQV